MKISRRQFLGAAITGGAVALGFAGLRSYWDRDRQIAGYGELLRDPGNLLDLPKDFHYHVVSRTGEPMDDGYRVPGAPDGMAAFQGPAGRTVLVRNHELTANDLEASPFGVEDDRTSIDPNLVYDAKGGLGGTSTFIYDTRQQRLEGQYLSLLGTVRNCAGGRTPWNSWVSCEESVKRPDEEYARDHGFNFEVPATAQGLVQPVPLRA